MPFHMIMWHTIYIANDASNAQKSHMKTIQITIDEALLADVDHAVQDLGANRSAFVRDALQAALEQWRLRRLEAQHALGYQHHPTTDSDFADWEDEQVWGES